MVLTPAGVVLSHAYVDRTEVIVHDEVRRTVNSRASSMAEGNELTSSESDEAQSSVENRHVPRALCASAAALWAGCALAESSGWCEARHGPVAAVLGEFGTWAAIIAAIGALILTVLRGASIPHGRLTTLTRLSLLAIAALFLGAGLRFGQTAGLASQPTLIAPQEGTLTRIEATLLTQFVDRSRASDVLSRHLEKPERYDAVVGDVVFVANDGTRMPLADTRARLRVTVRGSMPDLAAMDRVEMTSLLRGLPPPVIPGTERFGEHLALDGIVGFVSVDSPDLIRCISPAAVHAPVVGALLSMRDSLRGRIRDGLLSGVPDDGVTAIRPMLVALVLGDVEDGYRPIEDAFREVGLSHILAISGFNLAVLGWVVGAAAGLLTRDERLRSAAIGIAALAALALMAPAASAIRSCLMAIVGAIGGSCGRDWNSDALLAIAAVLMLLRDPSDAVNPGFQLSFGCVLALRHLATPIAVRWLSWLPRDDPRLGVPVSMGIAGEFLTKALASGLAAFLVSTPIVLVHFGSLQPFGILLTLLCAPLSALTLMIAYPKAIIGAISEQLTAPLGPLVWVPSWLQVQLVDVATAAGARSISVGALPWLAGVMLCAAIVSVVIGSTRALRRSGWFVIACIAAGIGAREAISRMPDPNDHARFTCTMFAVGDGTAIGIESGGSLVLFDGGSSSMSDVASRALIPWISERGGVVDALFISHPDLDHLSSLVDVANRIQIKTAYVHPTLLDASSGTPAVAELLSVLRSRSTSIVQFARGDSVEIGTASWTALWPDAEFRSRRDNDLSLVIMVERHGGGADPPFRILLSGDIETEPAARLAAMHARGEIDLSSDVVELPHHGSWREAVVGYLAAAQPSIILQSTARRRFAADRFAAHLPSGSIRLVTCRDGSIRIDRQACGAILASVFDPVAPDGWRPVAKAQPTRRHRRLRALRWLRATLSPRALPLLDEAGTLKDEMVAGDAVPSIGDGDIEDVATLRGPLKSDGCATAGGIEDDASCRCSTVANLDREARVDRSWLAQGDLAREDRRLGGCDQTLWKSELEPYRSCHRDLSEPKERLLGWIHSNLRRLLESIRRLRRKHARCSASRERDQGSAIEQERLRLHHRLGDHDVGTGHADILHGRRECPTRHRIERNVHDPHDRAIGSPSHGIRGCRLSGCGECDRRDPFHAQPSSRGASSLGCGRRIVRLLGGLSRRALSALLGRLERNLLSEREHEAADGVAIREQQHVRVESGGGAARGVHADLRKPLDLERDPTEPLVLERTLLGLTLDHAGKKLSIAEDDAARTDGRHEGHRARESADDACKDLGPDGRCNDSGLCGGNGRAELERVVREPLKTGRDPSAVAEEEGDGPTGVGSGDSSGDSRRRRVKHRKRKKTANRKSSRRKPQTGSKDIGSVDETADWHGFSALEDRQVTLRHLKDDQCHRRAVRISLRVGPRSIGILFGKEFLPDGGPPDAPAIAARQVHRLYRVVVTVEVVGLRKAARKSTATARKRILLEVVKATIDGGAFVDAGIEETRDSRGRARPRRAAEILHVAEATVGVLARTHVANRIINRRLRHLDAGVARTAKRHHLTDRDGDVGVVRDRVVAPAALVVLAANDQLHRAHECIADPVVVLIHPVDLAKKQRRKPMSVHRAMRLVGDKKPCFRRMREYEAECLLDSIGMLTSAWNVAICHKGDRAETRDADMLSESTLAEGAVALLAAAQVLKSLADRLLKPRSDLLGQGKVLRASSPIGRRGGLGLHWVRGHWRRGLRRGGSAARPCSANILQPAGDRDTERCSRTDGPGVDREKPWPTDRHAWRKTQGFKRGSLWAAHRVRRCANFNRRTNRGRSRLSTDDLLSHLGRMIRGPPAARGHRGRRRSRREHQCRSEKRESRHRQHQARTISAVEVAHLDASSASRR